VWESTPDTFQFTFVSRQSEQLLGYTPEQWLANPKFWHEHLHPEDARCAVQTRHDCAARHERYSYEYRMIAADQRVVWIQESGVILVEQDKPAALRGILLDITAQKQAAEQLDRLNRRLIDTSRQAGMAEVATGVLHNVGNVLNSVNVSATLVRERLRGNNLASLTKLGALLQAHVTDLGAFFTSNPKGQAVPRFITGLAEKLEQENAGLQQEVEQLARNVEHIKEIVAMQQSYAKVSGVLEQIPATDLVNDALQINNAGLLRHGIQVIRRYDQVPPVLVDRHKVLQILVNLVRNAKYALDASGRPDRQLEVSIGRNGGQTVKITVKDNGIGIAPENLTRIFSHGFTTRKGGHGFGLHSGANAAKEMGGQLTVQSEGCGKGAAFTLELPLERKETTS
jgi:PAS domain S-box-containing protein